MMSVNNAFLMFTFVLLNTLIINCSDGFQSRAQECSVMVNNSTRILLNVTQYFGAYINLTLDNRTFYQQKRDGFCPPGCRCNTVENATKLAVSIHYVTCVLGGYAEMPRNLQENTTFLDMSFNDIRELFPESFDTLKQLRHLAIPLNRNLRHLGGRWFAGLNNLKTLCLWSNPIQSVDAEAFVGLGRLEVLDLSDCLITELPDFLFSPLTSVIILSLHTNAITDNLNRNAFCNATSLAELIVSFNKLECFPFLIDANDQAVSFALPNLTTLDLSGNSIQIIGDEQFDCQSLQNLQTLYLDEVSIISYNNSIFSGFPNLRILSLQLAHSKVLRKSRFPEDEERQGILNTQCIMNALEQAIYYPGTQNCIQSLHRYKENSNENSLGIIPSHKCSLREVDFEVPLECKCSILANAMQHSEKLYKIMNASEKSSVIWTFQNMTKLEAIDLSGTTDAVILDNNTFTDSSQIKTLILNRFGIDNRFNIRDILKPLINLKNLQLSGNRIDSLNVSFLPIKLWTQLDEIDLSYNPFSCDCDIMWFRLWLNTTNVSLMNAGSLSSYSCAFPQQMKGVDILTLSIPVLRNLCFVPPRDDLLTPLSRSLFLFIFASLVASVIHQFRWCIHYKYFLFQSRYLGPDEFVDADQYEFDVFLVYNSAAPEASKNEPHLVEDSVWVSNVLVPKLRRKLLISRERIFDPEIDAIGQETFQAIEKNMGKSHKVLMILSNAFLESISSKKSPSVDVVLPHWQAQLAETNAVARDSFNIVMVLREEIAASIMTPRLQLQMQRQSYIEWTENRDGQRLFWKKLIKALKIRNQRIRNPPPMLSDSIELESR